MTDLIFRRCESGYAFVEDSRHLGSISKMWAFSTADEAAGWLLTRERAYINGQPNPDLISLATVRTAILNDVAEWIEAGKPGPISLLLTDAFRTLEAQA